jgi:hypothetical protein
MMKSKYTNNRTFPALPVRRCDFATCPPAPIAATTTPTADCYDQYCRSLSPSSTCKTTGQPRVCRDIFPPVQCECRDPPTSVPSISPSQRPTTAPSHSPTSSPTMVPSIRPSTSPTSCQDAYCQGFRATSYCLRNFPIGPGISADYCYDLVPPLCCPNSPPTHQPNISG